MREPFACRDAHGLPKKQYESRQVAVRAAHRAQHLIGKVQPYRCRTCAFYHIGHAR